MTTKKRGRPVGSKNSPKWPNFIPRPESLQEKLKEWDRSDFLNINVEKTNLQKVIDDKSFEVDRLNHQIIGYKAVISYLEHQLGLSKSQ
jgi:hypothetical protein